MNCFMSGGNANLKYGFLNRLQGALRDPYSKAARGIARVGHDNEGLRLGQRPYIVKDFPSLKTDMFWWLTAWNKRSPEGKTRKNR